MGQGDGTGGWARGLGIGQAGQMAGPGGWR